MDRTEASSGSPASWRTSEVSLSPKKTSADLSYKVFRVQRIFLPILLLKSFSCASLEVEVENNLKETFFNHFSAGSCNFFLPPNTLWNYKYINIYVNE